MLLPLAVLIFIAVWGLLGVSAIVLLIIIAVSDAKNSFSRKYNRWVKERNKQFFNRNDEV